MEETQPQTTKPISDDQELAKVLAGVSQETNNLGYEEAPAVQTATVPATPSVMPTEPTAPSIDDIKKDAISELRPLVDKLDLAPSEKFDTYLLLIRSTDDKTLIAPAHEAAKNIPDETKRAQALLDIIKEIDYLSSPELPII